MGLFGKKPQEENAIYETKSMGGLFWIKVYSNRVDFKLGQKLQSVPINQIASVQVGMMGQITLETTGGQKYSFPTTKKKEVQQVILDAQARFFAGGKQQTDVADEIMKLNELKEKGILTQEEFDKKKKQLLGL